MLQDSDIAAPRVTHFRGSADTSCTGYTIFHARVRPMVGSIEADVDGVLLQAKCTAPSVALPKAETK